jgi:hypothetical protein
MYFDDAGDFLPTSRHLFYRRGRPPMDDEGEGTTAAWMDDRREVRNAAV